MATTAKAKRNRPRARKEPPQPEPPKPVPKKKRKARAKGTGKGPGSQSVFLQVVKAENPDITADEFALKFNMPVAEVARHKAFINQFVKDYNIKRAALRMGYPETTAYDTGQILLGNAFAQLYLTEIQKAATVESVASSGQIAAKVWEEANRPDTIAFGAVLTSSSTRIAALGLLAKIAGLLTPKPKEEVVTIRRIMYVGAQITDWETQARQSQKALKMSTCIDV
jgi:hypothetical protein